MRRLLVAIVLVVVLAIISGCKPPEISQAEADQVFHRLDVWGGTDASSRRDEIRSATLASIDLKSVMASAADSECMSDLAALNDRIAEDPDTFCQGSIDAPILPGYFTMDEKRREQFRAWVSGRTSEQIFDDVWTWQQSGDPDFSKPEAIASDVLFDVIGHVFVGEYVVTASGPTTVTVGHYKEGVGAWKHQYAVQKGEDGEWRVSQLLTLGDDFVALEEMYLARGEKEPSASEIRKVFGKGSKKLWAGPDAKGAWWAAVRSSRGIAIGWRDGADGYWRIGREEQDVEWDVPAEIQAELKKVDITISE